MFKKFIVQLIILSTSISFFTVASANQANDQFSFTSTQQHKIQQFIQYMVSKYQFNEKTLDHLFQKAQYRPDIIKKITTPYESKSWKNYRKHFLTKIRIENGSKYWHENYIMLNRVKRMYGIPPQIITAIIGVETMYGKHTGNYKLLDSLSTLAFAYPPRSKFFTKELEQYLLLSRHQNMLPQGLQGSYAGAIGIPQFMPSSYRHYAKSAHNSLKINLNNNDDAIMSIANYLHKAKWQKSMPIAIPAYAVNKKYLPLLKRRKPTTLTIAQFKKYGIQTSTKIPTKFKATLLYFPKDAYSPLWLTFQNFRAILRYNPRINYAMAVFQLSLAIKKQYRTGPIMVNSDVQHKPAI